MAKKKKTIKRKQSKGECFFCNKLFSKGGMKRHLESCKTRKTTFGTSSKNKVRYYHIIVETKYPSSYWLHIGIPSSAKLEDLDSFLRDMWLECCDHLSAFTIGDRSYDSNTSYGGDGKSMNVKLYNVLQVGVTFYHDYDFGSTTSLKLRFVGEYKSEPQDDYVQLLSRNEAPEFKCHNCGKPATEICTSCMYEGTGFLCKECAETHECEYGGFLPVVNSPRMGVCGYTGGMYDKDYYEDDEDYDDEDYDEDDEDEDMNDEE